LVGTGVAGAGSSGWIVMVPPARAVGALLSGGVWGTVGLPAGTGVEGAGSSGRIVTVPQARRAG
jgi:hypothetical protein